MSDNAAAEPDPDETDVGWSEPPEPDDRERLLRDRPPHWDDQYGS
jgi:hypothetical protein